MSIDLVPWQKRQILRDVREEDLTKELERRAKARKTGLCDRCDRPLNSEPSCSAAYRHEGREPEDWEGHCSPPRISKDRWHMHYERDDGASVCMSRFPGFFTTHDLRVHLPCDGDGCDDQFCEEGIVRQHLDFDDDCKLKWPEDVKNFGPRGAIEKTNRPSKKRKHV